MSESFGIIYTNRQNVKHTSLEAVFTRYVAKVLLCDVLYTILLYRFSGLKIGNSIELQLHSSHFYTKLSLGDVANLQINN